MITSLDPQNEDFLIFDRDSEWLRIDLTDRARTITAECPRLCDFVELVAALLYIDHTDETLLRDLRTHLRRESRTAFNVHQLARSCAEFFASRAPGDGGPSFDGFESGDGDGAELREHRPEEDAPLHDEYSVKWEKEGEGHKITLKHILRSKRRKRKATFFWDDDTGVHWADIEDEDETLLDQLNLMLGFYQNFCDAAGQDRMAQIVSIMRLIALNTDTNSLIHNAKILAMKAAGYELPPTTESSNFNAHDTPDGLEITLPSAEVVRFLFQDEASKVVTKPTYPALETELLHLIDRDRELDVDTEETKDLLRVTAEKSQTLFEFLQVSVENFDPAEEEDSPVEQDESPEAKVADRTRPHNFASGWVADFLKKNPKYITELLFVGIKDETTYLKREHHLKGASRTAAGAYRTRSMLTDAGNPTDIARCAPPWLRKLPLAALKCPFQLEHALSSLGIEALSDLDDYSPETLSAAVMIDPLDLSEFSDALLITLQNGPEATDLPRRGDRRIHQRNITKNLHSAPSWIQALPVSAFQPPNSVRQAFHAAGIRTVSDLSQYTEAELLEITPMSWDGLQAFTHSVIRANDKCSKYPKQGMRLHQELIDATNLLNEHHRKIFTKYIGFMNPKKTVKQLAAEFGTIYVEIKRIIDQTILQLDDEMSWPNVLRMKLVEAATTASTPIRFSDFLENDPWFAHLRKNSHVVRTLAPILTKRAVNIVTIKDEYYIAPFGKSKWHKLVLDAKQDLKKAHRNDPHVVSCQAAVSQKLQGDAQMFSDLLWEEITEGYEVVGSAPLAKLQKIPRGISVKILKCLQESENAMSAAEIAVKIGAIDQGDAVPANIVPGTLRVAFELGDDRYGMVKHLPLTSAQAHKIATAAAWVIEDRNLNFRWRTGDILSELRKRNTPNVVELDERALFAILYEAKNLILKRNATWSHPRATIESTLIHRPEAGSSLRKSEPKWINRIFESPEMSTNTSWVDLFKKEFPAFIGEIKQVGITNDASYWKNEAALNRDTRTRMGLYRTLKIVTNPEDPTDLARCAPPWVGVLPIKLLNPDRRLRKAFAENQITHISHLEPLGGGAFPHLKGVGPITMAGLAERMMTLIAEGPHSAAIGTELIAHQAIPACEAVPLHVHLSEFTRKLKPNYKRVFESKLGIDRSPETLEAIARENGITKQYVHIILTSVIRGLQKNYAWPQLFLSKLQTALNPDDSKTRTIAEVIAADPWFEGFQDVHRQASFVEIAKQLSPDKLYVIKVGDGSYLAPINSPKWTKRVRQARAVLKTEAQMNRSETYCRCRVSDLLSPSEKYLNSLLWSEASKECRFSGEEGGRTLVSYGDNAKAGILRLLEQSETPLSCAEIATALDMNETYVHDTAKSVGFLLGKGLFALRKHIPLSDGQIRDICAASLEILSNEDFQQIKTTTLYDELSDRNIPGVRHIDAFMLNAVLGHDTRLTHIGYDTWTHKGSPLIERVSNGDIFETVLLEAGEPLHREDLLERAKQKNKRITTGLLSTLGPPIVRVDTGKWGLLYRDVPVTKKQIKAVNERLVGRLQSTRDPVSRSEIRSLFADNMELTPDMILSIARTDERLHVDARKGVSLIAPRRKK